jgi:hypothetical protein
VDRLMVHAQVIGRGKMLGQNYLILVQRLPRRPADRATLFLASAMK